MPDPLERAGASDVVSDLPPPARHGVDWRSAVRWFAAEFLVVVTGILVALGLQARHEGRRDLDRERAYLAQLDADLRDTDRLVAIADSANRASDVAAAQLLRAFYALAPPWRATSTPAAGSSRRSRRSSTSPCARRTRWTASSISPR